MWNSRLSGSSATMKTQLRYHENAIGLFQLRAWKLRSSAIHNMSTKLGSCQNHVLHVNCLDNMCTKGRDVMFHHLFSLQHQTMSKRPLPLTRQFHFVLPDVHEFLSIEPQEL